MAVRRVELKPDGKTGQAERIKEGIGQGWADRTVSAKPPRTEVAAGGSLLPLATHPRRSRSTHPLPTRFHGGRRLPRRDPLVTRDLGAGR
jgi:hypothetical protein